MRFAFRGPEIDHCLGDRYARQVADQRILGDKDFVKQVISSFDDLVEKNLRPPGKRINIKALAEKIMENKKIVNSDGRADLN